MSYICSVCVERPVLDTRRCFWGRQVVGGESRQPGVGGEAKVAYLHLSLSVYQGFRDWCLIVINALKYTKASIPWLSGQ